MYSLYAVSIMDDVLADVVIVVIIVLAIAAFMIIMWNIKYGDSNIHVNIFKYIELKVEEFNNASRLAT